MTGTARGGRPPGPLGLALLLGTLLHLRQVAYLAEPGNRYALHWERADAWALVATIAASAALVLGVDALLGRLPTAPLRRLRTPVLVWVALAGVLALLTWLEPPAWVETLLFWAALALAAASYASARGAERVRRLLQRAGRVLLPVPIATAAQILLWSPWGSPLDPLDPPPARRPDATPVYLLLFDGWSAEQSLDEDGQFREFLPHLRALAARSVAFQAAVSPDWETASSIPALLFGREEHGDAAFKLVARDGRAEWRRGDEREPLAGPSLFTPFAEAGYHTALIGYYLPYRRLLGDGVDVVRAEPHAPRGRLFHERLAARASAGARFVVAPFVSDWFRAAYRSRYSEHWYALNQRVFADALDVLRRWPPDTFLLAHWPTPHAPFVLGADGSYRGPFRRHRQAGTQLDYRRHLRNVDRIVGEVVAALERRGLFDRALLVLSSDHGWKGRDERVLHVPLLVKWPGQDRPISFAPIFRTVDLGGILAAVAGGERDPAWLRDYLVARARGLPATP